MATSVAASRKHVELSLELKRKLIQEHEHGVPFTLLGKKYHIATSTAANIWRKKDFFLRSRMSGSRKRCNDRSKYKIVNQVTALFVKSMLERNHKIDGEVIKRFARTAAAQCNFKDFHGSNGWLDSFKKRENVCWVRRRGAAQASGQSLGALEQAEQSRSTASALNRVQATSERRSDSPNLSTAAAAAAVAANAAAEHRHYHHHQQQQQQQQQQQVPASLSQQEALRDCHSPSAVSHCCWEEESCPRCTVAAAAAAIAALNSSDAIHEREHEIEDWFHGIPFLCQFFEEYQSLQQQQSDAVASGASSGGQSQSGRAPLTSQRAGQHQPAPQAASYRSLASSPPQCSSASSSCSSSLQQASGILAASSSTGSVPMLCSQTELSSSAGAASQNHLLREFHQEQQQQQQNQQQQLAAGSQSSSSSSSFKQMSELAAYERQEAAFAPDQMGSQEHLMEVNYTDSVQQQQAGPRQLMDCLMSGQSDAAGTIVATDYNSSDNDQEFYVAIPSQQQQHHQQQQHCNQPIRTNGQQYSVTNRSAQEASGQSQEELLASYQEEMSDHAEHCCRYEPTSSAIHLARQQQQVDEQAPLMSQQQQAYEQQQHQETGHCYLDEYEYENISTIRHYPLPSLAQFNGQQQQANRSEAFRDTDELNQTGQDCQLDSSTASFVPVSQQQQQQLSNSRSSSSSRLASATSSPPAPRFVLGNDPDFGQSQQQQQQMQQQQQQQQQQQHQQDYTNSLLLYEQEQTVEHADHEEHNLLHNALMRSPEKLKLIDSIITLLNYASNYNQKMLAPLFEIKRCIERDLEVVLSDTSAAVAAAAAATANGSTSGGCEASLPTSSSSNNIQTETTTTNSHSSSSSTSPSSHCCEQQLQQQIALSSGRVGSIGGNLIVEQQQQQIALGANHQQQLITSGSSVISSQQQQSNMQVDNGIGLSGTAATTTTTTTTMQHQQRRTDVDMNETLKSECLKD